MEIVETAPTFRRMTRANPSGATQNERAPRPPFYRPRPRLVPEPNRTRRNAQPARLRDLWRVRRAAADLRATEAHRAPCGAIRFALCKGTP
ncbi:MAG: hypothetical protein JWO85_2655 [Candidatus Eremiobacteraeota bacterium]|nr:hypothetical protein [Candidatus Eremiobacteraeota bacterium]